MLLFLSIGAYAQELTLIDSVKISQPIAVSIDRLGNYYTAHQNGTIKKYNSQNLFENDFSPQQVGKPSLIEAWNPLRFFVYYEGLQEYIFLDRFMTSANRFDLRGITEYCGLATVSADNNIWLVDLAEFGLKKYNTTYKQVTINTPFDLLLDPSSYEITHIREYQNLVFISDAKSGVFIFDNLGNFLRKLSSKGVRYFNFHQNNMYFLQDDQLKFIDIYTGKENAWSIKESFKFCLYDGTLVRLFGQKQMKIFRIPH